MNIKEQYNIMTDSQPPKQETAAIFTPPCECPECAQQYRTVNFQSGDKPIPYQSHDFDEEAQRRATNFTREIHENGLYLQQQCRIHGQAIYDKWKNKMNVSKREAMLKDVDRDMYPTHFGAMRANFSTEMLDMTVPQLRKYLLLPYINQEGL